MSFSDQIVDINGIKHKSKEGNFIVYGDKSIEIFWIQSEFYSMLFAIFGLFLQTNKRLYIVFNALNGLTCELIATFS